MALQCGILSPRKLFRMVNRHPDIQSLADESQPWFRSFRGGVRNVLNTASNMAEMKILRNTSTKKRAPNAAENKFQAIFRC